MADSVGKYKLIRELGRGATATVHLAEDTETGQLVAVKRVAFDDNDVGGTLPRRVAKLFRAEGSISKLLDHPNIVKVHEAVLDEHSAYTVMEYVEGRPLSDFVSFDRLLPLHRVVGIVFKCGLALDHAFRHGIVHRDIKPANILVDDADNVKILDFGLALNVSRHNENDSTFIMGVGSPSYMSPEQIKGYPLNQKTDLYSLGVVLYQLLTGRPPFHAANRAQLIYKILNAEVTPASALNPAIPPAMDKILQKALEKDLYSRYGNGAEMAKDLSAVRYQIVDDDYVPMDSRRFDVLRKNRFFRTFDDIELWEVLRISTWRKIESDTLLMREGDEDRSFGILLEGKVEVSLGGKKLGTIGPGEAVGETAYLDTTAPFRTNSVVTLTSVTYLEINPAALALATEECLEHFHRALTATVVKRLQRANEALSLHCPPARQASRVDRLELELEPLDEVWKRG